MLFVFVFFNVFYCIYVFYFFSILFLNLFDPKTIDVLNPKKIVTYSFVSNTLVILVLFESL